MALEGGGREEGAFGPRATTGKEEASVINYRRGLKRMVVEVEVQASERRSKNGDHMTRHASLNDWVEV